MEFQTPELKNEAQADAFKRPVAALGYAQAVPLLRQFVVRGGPPW